MSRELIALAVRITTTGDPRPNPYRIASWLTSQGHNSFFLMAEVRAFLGSPPDEIAPEIIGDIRSMLSKPKKNMERRNHELVEEHPIDDLAETVSR